ncbi:tripartite tricarboxylate transporter TctB family protein [Microbacterium jiangjiandongii]|uniref:tripartite tricarboxylate transporter TctB family protein n=1 Tax=Microbacterium jiangjiandongii TaxID=3049071 RepID=UPI00214CF0B5|nr:tripartite tricarboxylate transporter TctB family protein [Microbacterium sp. zg.Y843]MCR2816900.1 tripartite tricarboxylate transporter TctB family protein [Microbacterium sp. zg.Y843]
MTFPTNPTAASAVIGGRYRLTSGPSRTAALLKGLTMPIVIAAFATYLLVGILTMRVPEGTSFPGPQFFPGIIAAGLYVFAVVLSINALRDARTPAAPAADPVEALLDEQTAAAASAPARPVRVDVASLAWVVGSFLVFAFALDLLGWIIAAGLLFWCVARGFGSTKPWQSLVVGFTVSSVAYIGFDMMLGMTLPSGILGGF